MITIRSIAFMSKSELEGTVAGDIAFKYNPFTYVNISREVRHSVQRIDSGASKLGKIRSTGTQ